MCYQNKSTEHSCSIVFLKMFCHLEILWGALGQRNIDLVYHPSILTLILQFWENPLIYDPSFILLLTY